MEIRQLLAFKTIAQTGGFTRAAELLGYAQSSITAQIQTLELELGAPLFDRLGKKVVLTEAGMRLFPYAQEMIRLHDSAKEITGPEDSPSGKLVIGAPESLAAFRLPAIIQEYRRKFPKVQIILKPGVCWELRSFIRSGELDMAFLLEQESQSPDLNIETLVYEKMALIAPIDHPLVRFSQVLPEHLKDETILQTEPGCSYRALFEKYLRDNGIYPNPDLEFWSIEAIKNCVMCGLGIALLPAITVKSELQVGKLTALAWDDRSHRVATQLVYHKSKWVSSALAEFLVIVRKHAFDWRSN